MDQPRSKSYSAGDFPDKTLNATVGAYYRSIRIRIFLREAAGFCAVALFLAGGIVLSWRLAFPGARRMPMVFLSIGLVIAAAAAAMYRATRLAPSKRRLVVWLDARIGGGGFLASSLETDCSAWADRIRVPRKPERILKFSATSLLAVLTASRLLALLTGAVFLPAALLVDTGRTEEKPGMLDTREEIEELKKDLAILEQDPLVRKEEIAEIGEALEKVQAESNSTDPARTFEAIDAIRDQIAAQAVNAALSKEHSAENMKRLSQAASALAGLQAEDKDRIKGTEQFLKLAEKLAEDDALLKDFLKENADLISNLKPEQLMELAKMMDLQSVDLQKSIDELKRIRTDTMPRLTGPDRETGLQINPALNNTKEFQQWLQDNAPGANELIQAAYQNASPENATGEAGNDAQGSAPGGTHGNPTENASGEAGNDAQGSAPGGTHGNPTENASGEAGNDAQGSAPGGEMSGDSQGASLKFSGTTQEGASAPGSRPVLTLSSGPSEDGPGVTIREERIVPVDQTPEDAEAGQLDGSGKAEHSETRILPSHRESVRRYNESVRRRGGDPADQP